MTPHSKRFHSPASRARCRRKSGAQLADFKLPTLTHRNDVSQFLDFLTHISFCFYFPDSVREAVANIISSPKFVVVHL